MMTTDLMLKKIFPSSLFLLVAILTLSGCVCKRGGQGGYGEGDSTMGSIPPAAGGGILPDVNFDFDSSEILPSAKPVLEKNAAWIKAHPKTTIAIEGHCDERGTNEYNLALGERRARSVLDYLRDLGTPTGGISTISYGEEIPLDPGHDETAWAKNRRAHFSAK